MKNKKILVFLILLSGLTGCLEKIDRVEPWQNKIVETITNKEWHRISYSDEETDSHEIWTFKMDATGSYKSVAIYKNETIKEEFTYYFKWTFTSLSYDMTYMDDGRYWQIKNLTSEKLCINETFEGPIEHPESRKEYKEYTIKK